MGGIEGNFVGEFEQRRDFPERGPAEQATRAVLRTLGEVLPEDVSRDSAALLPDELSQALTEPQETRDSSFQQFLDRVARRQDGVDADEALKQSQLVVGMLAEVAPDDEVQRMRKRLPELEPLFEIADRHLEARQPDESSRD